MSRTLYKYTPIVAAIAITCMLAARGFAPPVVSTDVAANDAPQTSSAGALPHRGWAANSTAGVGSKAVDVEALAHSLVEQGHAALADGDLKRGFEAYRRAVEYFPSAETHGLVGDLYLRMAVRSEAAFHLRRAAELDPDNPDRWLAVANAYYLATDPIAASKAIDHAKQLDPSIIVERDDNNFVVRGLTGTPRRDS